MDESYDIFRREIDGKFVWIGAAEPPIPLLY
jgi:hypothetical protein